MIRYAILLALIGATPAPEATVDAAHPDSIVAAVRNAGYKAVLAKDDSGDPKITSAASGATFTVFFYGCEKHVECRSVQFYAGYTVKEKPELARINEWNRDNRFGTAFIDKSGDPNLQWDVVTEGGMPEKLFAQSIDRWASTMGAFQTYIGW